MNRSLKISLLVTTAGLIAGLIFAALPGQAQAKQDACAFIYKVQPGDTIFSVARIYFIPVKRLALANNLKQPYSLTPGQKLCISNKPEVSTKVVWHGKFDGKTVAISGSGFNPSTPLQVLVKQPIQGKPRVTTLGTAQTSPIGNLEASFPVRGDLADQPSLKVCLKKQSSTFITCKRLFRSTK